MTWGVSNYNATPASNTNINGINIAEGCNASGVNDAIRQLMADIAALGSTFVNTIAGRSGAVTLTTADVADLRIGTKRVFVDSEGGGSAENDIWIT